MIPDCVALIDIDGLRADVFQAAIREGRAPNLARIMGGSGFERGLQIPALAPAPSITFVSQASLFTGGHPAQHGIAGNEFFDRFGSRSRGKPRHYAFDVGDKLAVDDAVLVFTDGLASDCLLTPTLYEQLGGRLGRSVVVGHMYARGADTWLPPSLTNLVRFTKGGNLFGLEAEEYDRSLLEKALNEISRNGTPKILTLHFLGLDHESHAHGPEAQMPYLCEVLDGMVAELWEALRSQAKAANPSILAGVISDHGQIGVPDDDRHSLRLAFPFEREMGHLFDALGLDVHDKPGEDPDVDAVVGSNGGLAHVYLQNRRGRWADPPEFERDVRPVAKAFWEAHASGRYAAELEGSLAAVLVRNVERDGWNCHYQALTPQGELIPLEAWFQEQPAELYADPVHRLNNLAGPRTGDLLLVSNYAEGFYFAAPVSGVHGGLHGEDSGATLAFGWPEAAETAWDGAGHAIQKAIAARCGREGGRQPSTADMLTGLRAVIG